MQGSRAVLYLQITLCGYLLAMAIYNDLATREIPNYIPLAFLALSVFSFSDFSWYLILNACLIYLFFLFLWKIKLIGGGDVKLIAASSLCLTAKFQLIYIINIALSGGILALLYLVGRTRFPILPNNKRKIFRILRIESWRIKRGGPLPYAVAIAAGFAITVLQT